MAENLLSLSCAVFPLNPQKVADKVLYNLRLIERKINDSEEYGDGGKWITKFTAGNINAMVDESYDLLTHLQEQVERVKKRRKE